jgi:hypothetical protein
LLAPHQSGWAAEHGQVNQLDLADSVSMHDPAAAAARSFARRFDHDP